MPRFRRGLKNIGIIPTRMGTRLLYLPFCEISQDHPHAYGDKCIQFYHLLFVTGSSPRVWGQGEFICRRRSVFRIIPTRMGTSDNKVPICYIKWDHPHAYGDKPRSASIVDVSTGSSPRVWGQAAVPQNFINTSRIIPTRMGTSCACLT